MNPEDNQNISVDVLYTVITSPPHCLFHYFLTTLIVKKKIIKASFKKRQN
jgi:hypothetical protein